MLELKEKADLDIFKQQEGSFEAAASNNDPAIDCGDVFNRFCVNYSVKNRPNPADMPVERARAVNGN
jgi:hypothetical protein